MTNEYLETLRQPQHEFDAFGWNTLTRSSLPPGETFGLDFESAFECTPRWYGVSFGNGNDGVSNVFPSYCVRTADPWKLAHAALLANFNDVPLNDGPQTWREWASENVEVDGEAEFGITATIYDPPDEDDEEPDYEELAINAGYMVSCINNEYYWHPKDEPELDERDRNQVHDTEAEAWQACCEANEIGPDTSNEPSWSDANGAWIICEVFPLGGPVMRDHPFQLGFEQPRGYTCPSHDSLADCFDSNVLELVKDIDD
jgi:hypothetical protein